MNNQLIYPIWKPEGISSYDVIREMKKTDNKIKLGHCGTLDPFAEGILIICSGIELKNVTNYMSLTKTYKTEILFGSETDTLDPTGKVIKSIDNNPKITLTNIRKIMNTFKDNYIQSPPYFSAKKINGVRMYKYARQNIFIRPKGTKVIIYSYKIIDCTNRCLKLEISCGPGMYVRSLARDIAYELNTYAYVNKLIRTKIGKFNKNNSINFKNIKECFQSIS